MWIKLGAVLLARKGLYMIPVYDAAQKRKNGYWMHMMCEDQKEYCDNTGMRCVWWVAVGHRSAERS